MTKCSYCSESLGQQHKPDCIYCLGKIATGVQPLVTELECNHTLKHVEPLNTSQLGPVRVDPQLDASRAKVVRDALRQLSNEPGSGHIFTLLAQGASDASLAKLGRMLK